MPLVRIDAIEGRTDDEIKTLLDTIQSCIMDSFGVPDSDRYQIFTEHKANRIIMRDTGLGFERTEKAIVIHIFTSPRTPEMKKELYASLAEQLQSKTGLDPQDLFVAMTPNGVSDWSFGNGKAQYMTGDL